MVEIEATGSQRVGGHAMHAGDQQPLTAGNKSFFTPAFCVGLVSVIGIAVFLIFY